MHSSSPDFQDTGLRHSPIVIYPPYDGRHHLVLEQAQNLVQTKHPVFCNLFRGRQPSEESPKVSSSCRLSIYPRRNGTGREHYRVENDICRRLEPSASAKDGSIYGSIGGAFDGAIASRFGEGKLFRNLFIPSQASPEPK